MSQVLISAHWRGLRRVVWIKIYAQRFGGSSQVKRNFRDFGRSFRGLEINVLPCTRIIHEALIRSLFTAGFRNVSSEAIKISGNNREHPGIDRPAAHHVAIHSNATFRVARDLFPYFVGKPRSVGQALDHDLHNFSLKRTVGPSLHILQRPTARTRGIGPERERRS